MEPNQSDRFIIKPKTTFWVLIVLVILRGALYTLVVPPWQHPDEPSHFEHVRLIADLRKLPEKEDISVDLRHGIASSMARHGFWDPNPPPAFDDEALSKHGLSPIGIWSFPQPRLYFIVSAVWIFPWRSLPIDSQLFITRTFSILLNLVVVVCAYQITRILFPNRKWFPILVMAFVVFQPVNTDIMSAVNNDALVNALGATFFLSSAVIFRRGFNLLRGFVAILILVLAVLTKTTGLVLILTLPFAFLIYLWRAGRGENAFVIVLIALLTLALVVILWQLGFIEEWFVEVIPDLTRYFRVNVDQTIEALTDSDHLQRLNISTPVVYKSFWGAFGWRHIWIAPIWYWFTLIVFALSLIGLAIRSVRWFKPESKFGRNLGRPSFLTFAFIAILIAWAVATLRTLAVQGLAPYHSHGRYILIAIAPFALLFTTGLCNWVNKRWEKVAGFVYILGLIAFDAICFWGFLVPFYYL
jgi:hypothetical protein